MWYHPVLWLIPFYLRDGQFPTHVTAKPLANFICETLALAEVYLKCLYSRGFKTKWELVGEIIKGLGSGFDEAWKSFCTNTGGAESSTEMACAACLFQHISDWGCEKAVNVQQ